MAIVLRATSEGAPAPAASNGARACHGFVCRRGWRPHDFRHLAHARAHLLVLQRRQTHFHPLGPLGLHLLCNRDCHHCHALALGGESSGTGARRARAATKAWGGCGGRRRGGGGARVRPARGEAGAAGGAASRGGGGQSGQGREASRGGAPGGGGEGGGGRGQAADDQGTRCGGEPSCAGGAGRRRGV